MLRPFEEGIAGSVPFLREGAGLAQNATRFRSIISYLIHIIQLNPLRPWYNACWVVGCTTFSIWKRNPILSTKY